MPRVEMRLRKVLFFFALFAGFAAACGPGGSGDSDGVIVADEPHVFGDLWAMHYPSIIGGYAADHTYLVAWDEDDIGYEWSCFSTASGGEELAGTRTAGSVDVTVVDFMVDQNPCKWPLGYYLRVGICHQCANRGLYYTGKTVSEAPGYTFFVTIYGTYGNDAYDTYSMARCLDAAPDWQGAQFRAAPAALASSADSGTESDTNEEIALYHQYFGNHAPARKKDLDQRQLYRGYLDALFALKLKQQLRELPSDSVVAQLQQARNAFLDAKEALDRRLEAQGCSSAEKADEYQPLFDTLAQQYKQMLTPDQYERLFNLSIDARLIVEYVLPQ
jgi:hypothetical protein